MNQTTHIYFIRHGQSQGNLHHRFLGHTDLDLTDLGFRQAEKAAEFLTPVSPDLIVSSDLIRAYHTALPTAKQKGLPIKTYPELREIFAGQWENKEFTRIEEEFPESYQTWIEDTGNAHPDGGERVRDLALRFVHKVEELVQENEGKTIFVFAHATPIRIIKALWSGLPIEHLCRVPWPSNASVTHAVYENGSFSVPEYSVNSFLNDLSSSLPDEA